MKAVILAAGIGSRLRPLTDAKPKCLVKVCGKSLLDYQIDAYRRIGVTEVFVVVGYRGNLISDHVRHLKSPRVRIIENEDFESTNNMYSLHLLRDQLAGEPFFLNNADVAVSPEIISALAAHPSPDAIAVDVGAWNDESMKVTRLAGVLTDISKQIPQAAALGCSIDWYKFSGPGSRALFDRIDDFMARGNRNAWTEVAIQELMAEGAVEFQACPTDGQPWVEVDDYHDLVDAELAFSTFDRALNDVDVAFVDLDGTVFVGDNVIDGCAEAIKSMASSGIQVYFLSNNSSRDKRGYVEKLSGMGIPTSAEQIVLSSDGAIQYLLASKPSGVFVLGTDALAQQVVEAGLPVTAPDDAEFVLAGYDTELTYAKLVGAATALNSGADLIATHPDIYCPSERGPIPDIGAMLEMLRLTTGKVPVATLGKPNVGMVSHLIDDVPASRVVVVGDRPYTDLELARRLSAKAVLVLSGETTRDEVEELACYPTAVVPSLAYLGPDHR